MKAEKEKTTDVQKFFAGDWTLELSSKDNEIVPVLKKVVTENEIDGDDDKRHFSLTIHSRSKFNSNNLNIGDGVKDAHYEKIADGVGIYSITDLAKIKKFVHDMHENKKLFKDDLKTQIHLKLEDSELLFKPTDNGIDDAGALQWAKPIPQRKLTNAIHEFGLTPTDVQHMQPVATDDNKNAELVNALKTALKTKHL